MDIRVFSAVVAIVISMGVMVVMIRAIRVKCAAGRSSSGSSSGSGSGWFGGEFGC